MACTEKSQRLDVLAIAPGHSFTLYLEFKAYTGASMDASKNDLERVKRFSLNRSFDPNIFGKEFVDNVNSLEHEVGVYDTCTFPGTSIIMMTRRMCGCRTTSDWMTYPGCS